MSSLPNSLDESLDQAQTAIAAALEAGYGRLQVELVYPEIALEAQNLARRFADVLAPRWEGELRVLFPDTGAAALARRDWGEVPFAVGDLGSSRSPVEYKIKDSDRAFLVVCPSAVEVNLVESLCNLAGDRPVILLIPQLEDVSIVGIGYAARQLRERFLNTLESVYYIRPLEGAIVWRTFPGLWEVWLETEEGYQRIAEEPRRPAGEALERILLQATQGEEGEATPTPIKTTGIFGKMQQFLKALSS